MQEQCSAPRTPRAPQTGSCGQPGRGMNLALPPPAAGTAALPQRARCCGVGRAEAVPQAAAKAAVAEHSPGALRDSERASAAMPARERSFVSGHLGTRGERISLREGILPGPAPAAPGSWSGRLLAALLRRGGRERRDGSAARAGCRQAQPPGRSALTARGSRQAAGTPRQPRQSSELPAREEESSDHTAGIAGEERSSGSARALPQPAQPAGAARGEHPEEGSRRLGSTDHPSNGPGKQPREQAGSVGTVLPQEQRRHAGATAGCGL